MNTATLAAIPSALPAAPGSVLESWSCACGVSFMGHVHPSVRERFRAFFEQAHQRPECKVTESL